MLKKPMTTEELFDKIKGILQEKDKLPDGAWDNSFGTRNYKWSYRGSRTSDGCAAGYGLADDPVLPCQRACCFSKEIGQKGQTKSALCEIQAEKRVEAGKADCTGVCLKKYC